MNQTTVTPEHVVINGVDVTAYENIVEAVKDDPSLASFEFRAENNWLAGGLNRTTVTRFYGAGAEQGGDDRNFVIDAAEPPVLLGKDQAANPAEYLLHAMVACMTSSIVYKAAERGFKIESIESRLEGNLTALKFLEVDKSGRTGYRGIRAIFRIKSDAPADVLKECAEFSPVYDTILNGSPVSLDILPA